MSLAQPGPGAKPSYAVLASIGLVAVLHACADWLAVPANAVPVPQEHVLSNQWTMPAEGRVRVGLVRDAEHRFRQDCYDRVYVDGQVQAKLQPKEKMVLYLPQGRHAIALRLEGPCTGWGTTLDVILTPDRPSTWYRISSGWDGELYIEELRPGLD